MKLTGEEARMIVYGDVDESIWEEITSEKTSVDVNENPEAMVAHAKPWPHNQF